ncbi:hypothetical protein BGW37DRAFT_481031 [Umbelopsis sp. PMI_123]|nr:hypothetical protein BGW37DRAFT_481031 [Umbelopsis sp. PMI_123]
MYPYLSKYSTPQQWVVNSKPWDHQHRNIDQSGLNLTQPETENREVVGTTDELPRVKSDLFNAKLKIAEMVLKYEEYQKKIEQAAYVDTSTMELPDVDLKDLDSMKEQISATIKEMSSESVIMRLKQLHSRQKRKREWKRRHIKKLQHTRDKRQERRRRLHEEIDQWRVEWVEKEAESKKNAQDREKAEKQRKLDASKRNHERNNQLVVQKLLELRTLRRKKLKAQGHFFPDEGNEYFEQIRKLNEQAPLSPSTEDEPVDEEINVVPVHEDDKWVHSPLDMDAYSYWCQGNKSLDSLKRVRNQWDYYLSNTSSDIDSKVPPTWVNPSPPSSWVWATVLN